jgi:hypothetical protein
MTDELRPVPGEDTSERERDTETHEIDRGSDAPLEPDGGASPPEEPNPWLKEGADAPDAADIEEPSEQR